MDEAFLGRGWIFPPTFERATAGVDMLSGDEDVASSLEILLSTQRGERVMLPLYGCGVDALLFEPLDTRQKTLLKDMIETAILYHEPRVDVESVELRDDQELEGVVLIEVTYRVKSTNSRFNFVYPYYVNEGTDVNLTSSLKLLSGAS